MAIQITRREVLNNLIRFKDNVLAKNEAASPAEKRIYIALINRNSGEIRFAEQDKTQREDPHASFRQGELTDWKEVHLIVENTEKAVHFHLTGPKGTSLKPAHFDPVALRILFETLDVLNQLASQYHSLAENLVLQHLSDLHIDPIPEVVESIPGWVGELSRIGAEKKLSQSPVGTYLLRQGDQLTEQLALSFAQANRMPIKAYILTVVEGEGKISDRLLLQTQWGWTIALDDSDLSSSLYEYHATLKTLLSSMSNQLDPSSTRQLLGLV